MAAINQQFKLNKLAKDMGLKSKDLVEILSQNGIEAKTTQKALEPAEFDVLFETLTRANQISNIGDYLDGVTHIPSKPKKETPKKEAPAAEEKPAEAAPVKVEEKPAKAAPEKKAEAEKKPEPVKAEEKPVEKKEAPTPAAVDGEHSEVLSAMKEDRKSVV